MAAVHPHRANPPNPLTAPNGRAVAPDGTQLRNSCEACAASKLKCSKEKPACHRCAKRGLTCEYFAVKRAGRKPNSSRSSVSGGSSNPGNDARPSPDSIQVARTPKPEPTGSSTDLQELVGSIECTEWNSSLASVFTEMDTTSDDYFASQSPFSADTTEFTFLSTTDPFPKNLMTDMTMISEDGGCHPEPSAFPDSFPDLLAYPISNDIVNDTSSSSNIADPQAIQATRPTGVSCTCMTQALGSMKQTYQVAATANMMSPGHSVDTATALKTVLDVVAKNKDTIQAVIKMLNCSASHDGYLLAIISFVMFKVLALYGAILCKTTNQQSTPHQDLQQHLAVSGRSPGGGDLARMAAQLVLGELHHLRHVIEQLVGKLQIHSAKQGTFEASTLGESAGLDPDVTFPLSAAIYDQLDVDLTKRLKGLSWGIIDQLTSFREGQ